MSNEIPNHGAGRRYLASNGTAVRSNAMKVAGACLLGLGLFLARTAASAQAADSVPPAVNLTQLSQTLSQIEQSAQQTGMDLGRLRIDKWKTGSDNKRQSQADADSVRTNMTAALPTMT